MTGAEKLTRLVQICEGGNARRFAAQTGIPTASLSRARNGKYPAEPYYPRVLRAYPSVRRDWLYDDKGEPTTEMEERSEVLNEVKALRKEVARLMKMVENLSSNNSSKKR